MQVLKSGTRVKTIIGDIDAFVVGVMIEEDTVCYKLRYFANGEEKVSWLNRFEIEVSKPKQTAGFGNVVIDNDIEEVKILR